ncbi:MAG: septum formation initiator family protein [Planctomycetota bacterium]
MSGWKGLRELLFWIAALLGAGILAPSLILPAWLDHQAQREYLAAHQAYVAALQYRLRATRTQIEHLEKDPAYVLRLARQEFGRSMALPGGEPIRVAPDGETTDEGLSAAIAEAGDPQDVLPELSAVAARVMQRYPHVHMFIDGRRGPLMALGGVLVLMAVLLMGLTDGDPARRRLSEPRPEPRSEPRP